MMAAAAMDGVRRAMLEALGSRVPPRYQVLPARIVHAIDAERLWYLRSELMQALASMHGEAQAMQELARISAMFDGLVPAAMLARKVGGKLASECGAGARLL
jgi:hypothetical protein